MQPHRLPRGQEHRPVERRVRPPPGSPAALRRGARRSARRRRSCTPSSPSASRRRRRRPRTGRRAGPSTSTSIAATGWPGWRISAMSLNAYAVPAVDSACTATRVSTANRPASTSASAAGRSGTSTSARNPSRPRLTPRTRDADRLGQPHRPQHGAVAAHAHPAGRTWAVPRPRPRGTMPPIRSTLVGQSDDLGAFSGRPSRGSARSASAESPPRVQHHADELRVVHPARLAAVSFPFASLVVVPHALRVADDGGPRTPAGAARGPACRWRRGCRRGGGSTRRRRRPRPRWCRWPWSPARRRTRRRPWWSRTPAGGRGPPSSPRGPAWSVRRPHPIPPRGRALPPPRLLRNQLMAPSCRIVRKISVSPGGVTFAPARDGTARSGTGSA